MGDRDLNKLDPEFQVAVEAAIVEYNLNPKDGWVVFVSDGRRSVNDQNDLWDQGRSKPGKIVTWVRGKNSKHTQGLAVDFAFQKNGKASWAKELYEAFDPIARKHGLTSGYAKWKKDRPHYQKAKDVFEESWNIMMGRGIYSKASKGWHVVNKKELAVLLARLLKSINK